jgi:hypothetical protein
MKYEWNTNGIPGVGGIPWMKGTPMNENERNPTNKVGPMDEIPT